MQMNVNEIVWVKLTEHGKSVWKKHWEDLKVPAKHCELRLNWDGRARFQMWELMQVFGPAMYCGGPNVFEDNLLYFTETI